MIRNLNFFFKKISEEERIISERVSSLRHQQHRLEADRATIVDQRRHEEVIDLTDQQIQIQNLDPAVVQFNLLGIGRQMEPTTGVVQVVRAAPRVRKPRPVNWRDIAWDYICYNDILRTVRNII